MTVEIPHIPSSSALKAGFESLARQLAFIKDIDTHIDDKNITGSPAMWQWDFPSTTSMISASSAQPDDSDRAFKRCLMEHGYKYRQEPNENTTAELSKKHGLFFEAGSAFQFLSDPSYDNPTQEEIDSFLTGITEDLPSDDARRVRRELTLMLFEMAPDTFHGLVLEKYPDDMIDSDLLTKLCCESGRLLRVLPKEFRTNREMVIPVLTSNSEAFQFAEKELQNHKPTVLTVLRRFPSNLKHASTELRNDNDVIMTAVEQSGSLLKLAGEIPRNQRPVALTAIQSNPSALEFCSPALQNDRDLVMMAVKQSAAALRFASPALQDDRALVMAAIENPQDSIKAANYIGKNLRNDEAFMLPLLENNYPAFARTVGQDLQKKSGFTEKMKQAAENFRNKFKRK